MTSVSFFSILLAGIVSVGIGMLWYHPRVFGGAWMRMTNITPETVERGKRRMLPLALVGLVASMLIAWVMNSLGVALGVYDWVGAIFELALWCWLGFAAPVMLGSVLWEGRPLKLYLINALYWLVSFVAMALILLYA